MFARYSPWPALRFNVLDDPTGGGDLGFPEKTSVAEMTPEQQLAYWKHQARKHEDRNKARSDYDQLKADSEELARLRAEAQSEQEKAIQQARDEALREGQNLGASRYLTDAIRGELRASTGKTNEELATVMEAIDPSKFVTTNGDIDTEKLSGFAKSFGVTGTGPSSDPVRDVLNRTQTPPANSAGSVNELRKQRREALTKH